MRVAVVTPAYNEAPKVRPSLEALVAAKLGDVFAVNDGSKDGTGEVMASVAGVTVLHHAERRGVGAALRTGFARALEGGYDIVAVSSCVGKSRPEDVARLVDAVVSGGWDFVQGSRYLAGGAGVNMPAHRSLGTRGYSALFSLFAGHAVTDGSSGIRAVRAALLRDPRLDLDQAWLDTYELEPYLYYKALTLGFKVTELPISILYPADRKASYTKMRMVSDWWRISRPLLFLRLGLRR
ncbi:MAG: glycosyltransferase family 2 protein [Deltaproteobacteria bacterium]|nr:glycosyltransferase family 2 protein [Deltaproteobacteria bacterium]